MTTTYTQAVTFASLVDEAVERAKEQAAPFTPSRAQYEDALNWALVIVSDFADPWAFIKATHRGAGTMDAVASELFKRLRASA
jgi:hypothetical protein